MSDAKLSLAGSEPLPAPALLPEGVVTFLLTDIEASTQHWEEHPGLMQVAMETHDEILSMAVEASDDYAEASMVRFTPTTEEKPRKPKRVAPAA